MAHSKSKHRRVLALLVPLLLSGGGAAQAQQTLLWLSTADETTMATALTPLLMYGPKVSDFSDDYYPLDYGSVLNPDFVYWGQVAGGGNFRLLVVGQVTSPAPSVTPQPAEPGNFTNRTGLPVEPEIQMQQNNAVGVESPVPGASRFWVHVEWNSSQPMPNFGALQGVTVSGVGPFKGHY